MQNAIWMGLLEICSACPPFPSSFELISTNFGLWLAATRRGALFVVDSLYFRVINGECGWTGNRQDWHSLGGFELFLISGLTH